MAVTASRVTSKAALDACHACAVASFDAATVCTPGFFWPSRNQLDAHIAAGGRIYAASDATGVVGFVLVNPDGQILWIKGNKATVEQFGAVLIARVVKDCGGCYGYVHNDTLRARIAAAAPNHIVDDGPVTGHIWWKA
jgi:hypothetical protein